MNCPVCNAKLQMADRQGVEINYCPDCRGVWIDRGGLDRIIDRSGAQTSDSRFGEGEREYRELHKHDRHHESEGRHRKSFFSDLFD
jgi:Zn-finger nucleic acid-binding protein